MHKPLNNKNNIWKLLSSRWKADQNWKKKISKILVSNCPLNYIRMCWSCLSAIAHQVFYSVWLSQFKRQCSLTGLPLMEITFWLLKTSSSGNVIVRSSTKIIKELFIKELKAIKLMHSWEFQGHYKIHVRSYLGAERNVCICSE